MLGNPNNYEDISPVKEGEKNTSNVNNILSGPHKPANKEDPLNLKGCKLPKGIEDLK
jgi:hypothetical protein